MGGLNPHYELQQRALDALCTGLKLVRPDFHAEGADPNTVQLYFGSMSEPVWTFENTDRDGNFCLAYGNHGRIDLRGLRTESDLTAIQGALLIDLARSLQIKEICICGGILSVGEANDTFNNATRLEMQGMKLRWGNPIIGEFNQYDNDMRNAIIEGKVSPFVPYPDETPRNFCADFILPPVMEETADDYARLTLLLRLWSVPFPEQMRFVEQNLPWYRSRAKSAGWNLVEDISNLIHKLNGRRLMWT